jgi:hypothetical protein
MKRYIARYSGKDGFEERYEVIDTNTGESISGQLPYHTANDKARMLNQEPDPSAFGLAPVAMVAPAVHAELAADILKSWQAGAWLIPLPADYPVMQITLLHDAAQAAIMETTGLKAFTPSEPDNG